MSLWYTACGLQQQSSGLIFEESWKRQVGYVTTYMFFVYLKIICWTVFHYVKVVAKLFKVEIWNLACIYNILAYCRKNCTHSKNNCQYVIFYSLCWKFKVGIKLKIIYNHIKEKGINYCAKQLRSSLHSRLPSQVGVLLINFQI